MTSSCSPGRSRWTAACDFAPHALLILARLARMGVDLNSWHASMPPAGAPEEDRLAALADLSRLWRLLIAIVWGLLYPDDHIADRHG